MASLAPTHNLWGYHYTVKGISDNPHVAMQIYDIIYANTHYAANFRLNPSKVQDYVEKATREVVANTHPYLTKLFGGNKLSRGSHSFAKSLIYDPSRGGVSQKTTLANAKLYLKRWENYHDENIFHDGSANQRFITLGLVDSQDAHHHSNLGAGQASSSYY